MLAIHHILHPTDFSERSELAFRLACSLALDHGARLTILHVTMPPPVGYVEGTPVVLAEPAEDCNQKIWWEFDRLSTVYPGVRELRIEAKVVEGSPATEILNTAKENGCDLIVMGTHGRSGLGRLLMGSVAEVVVRKASCPVLTVKAPTVATKPSAEAVPEAALAAP